MTTRGAESLVVVLGLQHLIGHWRRVSSVLGRVLNNRLIIRCWLAGSSTRMGRHQGMVISAVAVEVLVCK